MTEMTRILTKYLYLGELFLFAPDKHWRPIEVEATDSKDDTVTAMMLYNMVEDIMPFCAKIVKEAGIDCIEDDIFFFYDYTFTKDYFFRVIFFNIII